MHATLLKYLIRASTRSTPYGTFAGCLSPGAFSARTEIRFDEHRPPRQHTRLRTDCLTPLLTQLIGQPAIHHQSTFHPNSSLCQWGMQYRYTFYTSEQGVHHYSLCSVDASPYLKAILHAAAAGASLITLVNALAQEDVPPAVAEDFIRILVEEQVLVSALQTKATGEEALTELIDQLHCWESTFPEVRRRLEEVQDLLARPTSARHHHRLTSILPPEADHSRSVTHTDLFFATTHNTLNRSAMEGLTNTLSSLMVLDQGNANPALEDFKQRFYQRYEEQEVPLLQALDSELGVGYGKAQDQDTGSSPMQEAIDLSHDEAAPPVRWDYWKDFVLRRYSEALRQQQSEIVLHEEDLDALRKNHRVGTTPPATCTAWGSLLAASENELDQGAYQFHLRQLAGPSGVSLLGRFCYGDPALKEQVKELIRKEEQAHPEVIFAEVAHLPSEREGMVASRPTLRRYEIPVLTRASVAPADQIPLSDLLVSVKQGRHLVCCVRGGITNG